jgi:hypothetical protein
MFTTGIFTVLLALLTSTMCCIHISTSMYEKEYKSNYIYVHIKLFSKKVEL